MPPPIWKKPIEARSLVSRYQRALDDAHRRLLGDAGVGDAVEAALEQRLLVGRSEIAIVRDALVGGVRDQVEQVLLEVRAGGGDRVHLVAADHLGEREAELRG